MQVKEGGGSEEKHGVWVTSTEEHELSGSKGSAHLVMKFAKGSKREVRCERGRRGAVQAGCNAHACMHALHLPCTTANRWQWQLHG